MFSKSLDFETLGFHDFEIKIPAAWVFKASKIRICIKMDAACRSRLKYHRMKILNISLIA